MECDYKIRHFILIRLVNPKYLCKVLTHTLPHSGFRRGVNGIFALLGCYAAYIWYLVTNLSRQPIGRNSKGQEIQGLLDLRRWNQ